MFSLSSLSITPISSAYVQVAISNENGLCVLMSEMIYLHSLQAYPGDVMYQFEIFSSGNAILCRHSPTNFCYDHVILRKEPQITPNYRDPFLYLHIDHVY